MNTRIRRFKEHPCCRCGETITNNRSEFCDECYPKYIELRDLYRVARRFPVLTRECTVCHKPFYTKRTGRIYCSDECQYAVEKEGQRIRSARRRLDYLYGFSRVSAPELEIQKLFPEFSIAHWHPDWMEGKEIDLYAPEFNVALEYDGIRWHSGLTKSERKEYAAKHIEKTDLCEKHGIQLIHLFETEWLDSRDCVIDKLSAIFHRPMERYMARKCYTEVVESGTTEFNKCRDEVVAFLNRNHIQGAGSGGTCRVMLRDKATGELRAVCCFQNRHGRSKATKEEWDLCRYATALGTTVAGGITKCISAFKGAHPECKVLTSLADRRWTSTLRSAYSSSGFEWDGETAHADYFYVVKRDGRPRLVNKSNYQLKFIDREFPETFVEGADNTEWARMERAGVPYIYDCGKLKYVMKFN